MNDVHGCNLPSPTDRELKLIRDQLLGFCFPNSPRCDQQEEALRDATWYQYEHAMTQTAAMENGQIPEGVESFRIGDFQMSFRDGLSTALTRKTICPSAYAVLLRAGLLYRGVERGCC